MSAVMIEELRRLHRCVDVETLPFDDAMRVFRAYVGSALLSAGARQLGLEPGLCAELRDLLANAARRSDPDPVQREADRAAAWQLQMSLPAGSPQSRMAEVVALCTYDRESAEFDTFGPEPMIESIMTSMCGVGEDFCRGFVDVVIQSRPRDGRDD